MKLSGAQTLFQHFCYPNTARLTHYKTRGDEWRGGIAANLVFLYVSVICIGINEWRITVARKLISSEVDSISPGDQSLTVLQIYFQEAAFGF